MEIKLKENGLEIWSIVIENDEASFWDTVPEIAVPLLEELGFQEKKDFLIKEKRLRGEYADFDQTPFLLKVPWFQKKYFQTTSAESQHQN